MIQNKMLREQYEDALFALLMHEFAEQESEQLLKALNGEASEKVKVSLDTEKRILKRIKSCFAKCKRRKRKLATGKVLRYMAAIITVASMLFSVAWALSEDVRVTAMNLYFEIQEHYTRITMQDAIEPVVLNPERGKSKPNNQANNTDATLFESYFDNINIGWIPDGFELYSYQENFEMTYVDKDDEWFRINGFPFGIYASYSIDTENAELVEEITINGMSGMAVVKNGQPHVVLWYINAVSPNDTFVIDIDGSTGVTLETIKTVSENLTVIFNECEE